MRHRPNLVLATALAAALSLFLAACGDDEASTDPVQEPQAVDTETTTEEGEPASADPLEELVAAAQEEGSLLWYSSPSEEISQRTSDAFQEAYGIQVEFVRLAGADLAARYSAEAEAGNIEADVALHASAGFINDGIDQGWFLPLDEELVPGYGEFPDAYKRDGTAVVQLTPWGICYNSSLLSEADVPDQWDALAEEEFADAILLPDPNSSDAYIQHWDMLMSEYGEDLLEEVAANVRLVYASGVPATEALGAGEGSMAVPCTGGLAARIASEGAPVEFKAPDLTTAVQIHIGISDGSANPNAARLFAHFLMSDDGSTLLNEGLAHVSPLGVGDGTLPADIRTPADDALDRRDQIMELLGAS